jgi:predicted transcriptional regulator
MEDYDRISDLLLDLASQKRRGILHGIKNNDFGITKLAESLDSTPPEIHRNVERLLKDGLIVKDTEKEYTLTPLCETLLNQISTIEFFENHPKYFKKHGFAGLPTKFLLRLGQLNDCKEVNGFVKVQEEWNKIYQEAEKYVHNILYEVSYSSDIVKTVVSQVNRGVAFKSIFSSDAIVSNQRQSALGSKSLKKALSSGKIERKTTHDARFIIVMNEKQACLSFPSYDSEVDVSSCLNSMNEEFLDWCDDYFEFIWNDSKQFREAKL